MGQLIEADCIRIKTSDLVNSDLWKLFPVINCDRCKDIPVDYPGMMGVPITFIDKMGRNDGHSGFIILGTANDAIVNGRTCYQRLFIRNLRPDLPEEIDLVDWLRRAGVDVEIEYYGEADLNGTVN